uniref:BTG anti-proliferation factor 3 n=1 Tax=Callithrix jacchus TaxID=9483 RepID=F7H1K1_CALJA
GGNKGRDSRKDRARATPEGADTPRSAGRGSHRSSARLFAGEGTGGAKGRAVAEEGLSLGLGRTRVCSPPRGEARGLGAASRRSPAHGTAPQAREPIPRGANPFPGHRPSPLPGRKTPARRFGAALSRVRARSPAGPLSARSAARRRGSRTRRTKLVQLPVAEHGPVEAEPSVPGQDKVWAAESPTGERRRRQRRYGEKNNAFIVASFENEDENKDEISRKVTRAFDKVTSDYHSGSSSSDEETSKEMEVKTNLVTAAASPVYQISELIFPPLPMWHPLPRKKPGMYRGNGHQNHYPPPVPFGYPNQGRKNKPYRPIPVTWGVPPPGMHCDRNHWINPHMLAPH